MISDLGHIIAGLSKDYDNLDLTVQSRLMDVLEAQNELRRAIVKRDSVETTIMELVKGLK